MKTTCALTLAALGAAGSLHAQNTANVVLVNDVTSPVTQVAADTRAIEWVDVDADGDLDLFAVDYAALNRLYTNDGGAFTEDTQLPNQLLDGTLSKGVAFGDVDGDGDQDAFMANGNGRRNGLLLNQGFAQGGTLGRFLEDPLVGGDILLDSAHTYDGAFGDVNGDGALDLVVANRYELNALYLGDGVGNFTRQPGSAISLDAGGSRAVALADLDGDLDLDVVIVNSGHEDNFAYVNQGGAQGGAQGEFAALLFDPIVSDGGTSYGVSVGDMDADGLPEVVVSNRHAVNYLYRNTSSGATVSFERVLDGVFSAAEGDSFTTAMGDLEGDGDVDLVVANRDDASAVFLADGGPFTFVQAPAGQLVDASAQSLDVALADIDGDGFLEVAFGNTAGASNFLFANLGPMWGDMGAALPGSQGPPRLSGQGQLVGNEVITLRVESAAADAAATLVIGLGQIFAPFKGGVLVPAPDVVVPGLLTDGAGELALHFGYPDGLPSGFALTLQTLVADGAAVAGTAFTNGLQATSL